MSSTKNPTRSKILATALSLLQDGAGSKIRMSDIAKAAGLSRQAVYLHFPSRADLLIAATRYLDELEDADAQVAPSRSAATGKDRLEAWIEDWGNYIPRIYGVAKALLAMKDNDPEAAAAWDDRMQAMRHGCAAAVARLAFDGVLTPELSETEATDLLWSLCAVRVWEQLRMECGWSQEAYIIHLQYVAARMLVAD